MSIRRLWIHRTVIAAGLLAACSTTDSARRTPDSAAVESSGPASPWKTPSSDAAQPEATSDGWPELRAVTGEVLPRGAMAAAFVVW